MHATSTRNNFVAVLFALAYTAFAAVMLGELVYAGYGESGPGEIAGWTMFVILWLTVLATSFLVATSLGAHRLLVVGLAMLSWLPAVFAAAMFVLASSCAGYGPHSCAFS
jgi:hypothetical protein